MVRQLLSELSPDERKVTAELLGYEPETASRLMTTEYIDLKEAQTAAVALEIVRRRARIPNDLLLICDRCGRRLTGILSLRDLVTADPSARISEV